MDYWSSPFYLDDIFTEHICEQADQCDYASYFKQCLQHSPPLGSFALAMHSVSGYLPRCVQHGSSSSPAQCGQSLGPAQDGVLQCVIGYTNDTITGSGNLDMSITTNGTLLTIETMTWIGMQGSRALPGNVFYVLVHPEYNGASLADAENLGYWGSKRGLTFYEVQLAGHSGSLQRRLFARGKNERLTPTELPEYAPGSACRIMELLLGRIEVLPPGRPRRGFRLRKSSSGGLCLYASLHDFPTWEMVAE